MSAQTLFKKTSGLNWVPNANAVNAPEGTLLRADNVIPDETGAMSLRHGSALLHTLAGVTQVHTLYTVVLGGTTYRIAGADSKLFRNGADFGVTFTGSGDIAMADDSYQVFSARGSTKKKFDGTTLNEWGIAAPALKPTLTATTAVFATVASFNSSESPAFTVNEGTGSFVAGYDGTGNGALKLAPNATSGRASASKIFAADTDLLTIGGADGGDTDLFDIYVALEDPRRVDTVTIMFGLNTGTDPYRDDYFSFDFRIRDGGTVEVKEAQAQTAIAYQQAAQKLPFALTPQEVTNIKTPAEVAKVLERVKSFAGPQSRERRDALEASPAWTHFSVTRGQFKRVGGTPGRDWRTVRGFKVVYSVVPGATEAAQFDSALFYGGGARSLTGKYRVGYRFVRDTGNYVERGPLSPVSDEIVLTQQALRVTIPAASVQGADPQVNQVWVYLFGGFLDTFYRVAITGSTVSNSTMRIDEFAKTADGTIDAADRTRLVNQGLSIPGFTPNADLVIDIIKSEMDALIDNEALEPGSVGPPDNIVAIAGPWANRMFAVTRDGYVYPSLQNTPSSFSVYHVVDLRRWGTPLWAVRTVAGIVVGMTKDVVRIGGTGDEAEDRITVDLSPEPLGIGNPPVDAAVFTDGHTIVYRAADGLMTLSGVALTPVDEAQVQLLWRGYDRHGVLALDVVSGRFRLAVDNHILYMVAPEGGGAQTSSPAVWRLAAGAWERTVYPFNLMSIHRDPDGSLIAGSDAGQVWLLESGLQDNAQNITVTVLTPVEDGGSPLSRKDPFDLQLHVNTGGATGTVDVLLDGSTTPAQSYSFYSSNDGFYRINVSALPPFIRAQLRIVGNFQTFVLHGFALTYRERPKMLMAVDTGYFQAEGPKDIVWLRQVELSVIAPSDLELVLIMDDVAKPAITVPVTAPNKHTIYRVDLAKSGGYKSRRPRALLRMPNGSGAGNAGFELYWMKLLTRASGLHTEKTLMYDNEGA